MGNFVSTNPFILGNNIDDKFFCDRQKETDFLIKQIRNGRNVALISPRRLGKTGLIKHLFLQQEIVNDYNTFLLDIYATSSLSEFVYLFGKTIFDTLKSRQRKYLEYFLQIVKSLRIGVRLDSETSEPVFEMGLGAISTPETTLEEIFRYLEKSERHCVVAIDEFQQIGSYPEKNIEAMLRTYIQNSTNVSFIFTGSKSHLMSNMFNSPNKPFYQSVITMGLEPIPMETYKTFAKNLFELYGKSVDDGVVEYVYRQYGGVTWFMQNMMNELFSLTPDDANCDETYLPSAENNIINVQEMGYREILAGLPTKQKMLLLAIAKEKSASNITSSAFIKKYNLPSASSVQSAKRPLLSNDIVSREGNTYRVYDYFFGKWLSEM